MKEQLSLKDIELIKALNFLRYHYYGALLFTGVLIFPLLILIPVRGWRKIPETQPADAQEYFMRLAPYLILASPIIILPLLNWLIKYIEIKTGTKTVKAGKVAFKAKLISGRKFILFKPFLPIIFTTGNLNELQVGDMVEMEVTWLGRLFNFRRIK